MRARKKLEKMVEDKKAEILELEKKLGEAKAYLEALEESLKLVAKHEGGSRGDVLRAGSTVFKAREALRQAGKPLHVNELLAAIGREVTKKSKVSLSGSLSTYVRNQMIFTRPAPNTFGLEEFGPNETVEDEPPEGFGGTNGE